MNTQSVRVMQFLAQPLTLEEFVPYGDVVEHHGMARWRFMPEILSHDSQVAALAAWVAKPNAAADGPLQIAKLERHAHSSQTFIPLTNTPYLVFVAGTLADGGPDISAAKAFVAAPHQGVCFRRGTWHHALSPLARDSQFLVVMGRSTDVEIPDDEVTVLETPCEVHKP